ncbi:head decoration protein [Nocardia otitidiscaviarum]|uniref:head decoration protein n=1 Tax=Nocardia otitidiscaviarum TaxID=1823 RepID=UPI0004A6B2D2|nr:head decoration protein [Nocardia otitidiscaviarum]
MSTDIGLVTTTYQVDNKQWLLSRHGTDHTPNVTLDISLFTAGTHYPNGYIPSGCVIGKVTATGLFGPYDDAAVDGRETAYGITFAPVTAVRSNGTTATKVGTGALVHGVVSESKLPFQAGAGSVDANGMADLKNIRFEA